MTESHALGRSADILKALGGATEIELLLQRVERRKSRSNGVHELIVVEPCSDDFLVNGGTHRDVTAFQMSFEIRSNIGLIAGLM